MAKINISSSNGNKENALHQKNKKKKNAADPSKDKAEVTEVLKPADYIHVRARDSRPTNRLSLAEIVRREEISESLLQDLVPGCNRITGKVLLLDESINYIQSLQRQVELGFALMGMVVAFIALLLSVVDLIRKARNEGITTDGWSLLPCFYRHSDHNFRNRKPFGSLVKYFGLAGAVWQCSCWTIEYNYTRQNTDNPIKIEPGSEKKGLSLTVKDSEPGREKEVRSQLMVSLPHPTPFADSFLAFSLFLKTPSINFNIVLSVMLQCLVGRVETEKASTNSNLESENAGSSCTRKTIEWTLLITSLLLEGISAIFDQLDHALMGMVMAFLALLLSIVDIFQKARKEGVTGDGRGLLPCFYHHLRHNFLNGKPFGSLVEYFGIAGAICQCSYSTIQYNCTRQNKDNPIKMCLLPFIFALCGVISRLVKSKLP